MEEGNVLALLPLDAESMDSLEDHPSVTLAQDECDELLGENQVEVVKDEEIEQMAVEILGPESVLILPCNCILQYLVLFVKNMDRYFSFEVEIIDDTQTYRVLKIKNAASIVRITKDTTQCPLDLGPGPGWRYVCVDLEDKVRQAYGTSYLATVQVRVYSTCRLLKAFFQDRHYSDAELPMHLKLMG